MNMISTVSDSAQTPNDLEVQIKDALLIKDPAEANWAVTLAHRALALRLKRVTGEEAGANFHAWAVWGSQKAGTTIRQEDLESALIDARKISGIVGGIVGCACAWVVMGWVGWPSMGGMWGVLLVVGVALGAWIGAIVGGQIARSSRKRAAALILGGNKLVLEDIGLQSAKFIGEFEANGRISEHFFEGLRAGPAEKGGQDLLISAFKLYAQAAKSTREGRAMDAQQACYHANLCAILHEHIKLQPYIEGSMPWIVRRCVTQRMMTYEVGSLRLAVGQAVPSLDGLSFPESLGVLGDPGLRALITGPGGWSEVPSSPAGSGAEDWSKIAQRMRYIVNLFRIFHLSESVFEAPQPLHLARVTRATPSN